MLMVFNEDIRRGSGAFPTWFLELRNMIGFLLMQENGAEVTMLAATYEALDRERDMLCNLFRRYFLRRDFQQYMDILGTV